MLPLEYLGKGLFQVENFVLGAEPERNGNGILRVELDRGQPVPYWKPVLTGLVPSNCGNIGLIKPDNSVSEFEQAGTIIVQDELLTVKLEPASNHKICIPGLLARGEYADVLMLDDGRMFCNKFVIQFNNLVAIVIGMGLRVG